MTRFNAPLIGLAAVILATAAAAQTASVRLTTATHDPSIFHAEILSARNGECGNPARGYCKLEVRARVMRILRDRDSLHLEPGELDASLLQWRGPVRDTMTPWTNRDVKAGQAYLIFGSGQKSLVGLFEWPEGTYLINPGESGVEDVDLILASLPSPLSVQANTIAAAISTTGKPRSAFLAEQAAALLGAGTSLETALLAQALENHAEEAFSMGGRGGLLYGLYRETGGTYPDVPQNLIHTFVGLIARYFAEPDPWAKLMNATQRQVLATTGLTPMQFQILDNYVPWILSSDSAVTALRTTVQPSRFQSLRKRTLELSVNPRLPPEYRTKVQKLLNLVKE